jgi:hypothetical protein
LAPRRAHDDVFDAWKNVSVGFAPPGFVGLVDRVVSHCAD